MSEKEETEPGDGLRPLPDVRLGVAQLGRKVTGVGGMPHGTRRHSRNGIGGLHCDPPGRQARNRLYERWHPLPRFMFWRFMF